MDVTTSVLRRRMVREQLMRRGIRDLRVLDAMDRVPRHLFVPESQRALAYADRPVPIGYGQTISQPYIVALMLEALELHGDERVLDVGSGSGYQAALLGSLAKEVFSVEILPELAESARNHLRDLGYHNVRVQVGDGRFGWSPAAPYDAIVVAAVSRNVPGVLVRQLGRGGRMVLPVGEGVDQHLLLAKRAENEVTLHDLGACAFVPLVGASVDDWDGRPDGDLEGEHGVL